MRAAFPVLVASMLAASAAAQQAPSVDGAETVAQPRFGTEEQPQDTVAQEPRFVPAPGASGIEVTPLPPPGEAAGVAVTAAPGDDVPLVAPGTAAAIQDGSGAELLTDQPAYGEEAGGPRFRPAPEVPAATAGPSSAAVPLDTPPTEFRPGVRLRELDKMTGQTETFELAVGETRQVDRLKIRLEACRSPETNDTHGTIAFLKVWDVREADTEAFSGWMFAESPSLSALDHPRYDLWVISCTTSSVAASSASE